MKRIFLILPLIFSLSIFASEEENLENESQTIDSILLKDEEPLKVNPRLSSPQKNVSLRAVQKEVLSISLPEESPEEPEEQAPVEE